MMGLKNLIANLSKELGLEKSIIEKVYKSYWLSIKEKIEELPLKDNLTELEFNKLKTSINIPALGKFAVSYNRYVKLKKNLDYKK